MTGVATALALVLASACSDLSVGNEQSAPKHSASHSVKPTPTEKVSSRAKLSPTPKPSATAKPSPPGKPYCFNPNTGGAIVSRANFGKTWPITVNSGVVNCVRVGTGALVAIFQSDRSTADHPDSYALNGTANSKSNRDFYHLKPIDRIWTDDPATGFKKDIGVLIDICTSNMG